MISIGTIKVYDKNTASFPGWYSQQNSNIREFPQPDKGHQQKACANNTQCWMTDKGVSLASSIPCYAEFLAIAIKQEKETEGIHIKKRASEVAQMIKNLPAMQETRVWSLGGEDPLEKGMSARSSILAWRIPQTEEPGRLQSMGLQRVRHDWATKTATALKRRRICIHRWQDHPHRQSDKIYEERTGSNKWVY